MDFLKNINKEFCLSNEYDFIKENYHYLIKKGETVNLGTIKVKTGDINMQEVSFYITEIEDIDNAATKVSEILSKRLTEDVELFKTIAQKVIKAWEETPEKFVRQKDYHSKDTFKCRGLLSDDEYHLSVFTHFGKVSYHTDFGFVTGCGGSTYYDKNFHVKCLNNIDGWLSKTVKELGSAKIKTRIKNQLLKNNVVIPIRKLDKFITLAETSMPSIKNAPRPPFPIKFTANQMNSFMNEIGDAYIDEDMVEEFSGEYDIDISSLLEWEVSYEHEGEHHNDGQICDYTITFTSPDGHEYCAYNSHCLMTGWNFYGAVEID